MLEELGFKFEHHENDLLMVPDELALVIRERLRVAVFGDDGLHPAGQKPGDVIVHPERLDHGAACTMQ